MEQPAANNQGFIYSVTNLLKRIWAFIKSIRTKYNQHTGKYYSPELIATIVVVLTALMAIIILYIPNRIGVADDGSLQQLMNQLGLRYLEADAKEPTGAWFIPQYAITGITQSSGLSTHLLLVRIAIRLDELFTPDGVFHIQFLSILYLLLYLPALWFMTRAIVARTKYPSEGTLIGVAIFLFFADSAYIAYFNSLYPEPVWLIGMSYCVGFGLALQKRDEKRDALWIMLFCIAGMALSLSENHCFVIAFILSIFCLRQAGMVDASDLTKIAAVLASAILIVTGFLSMTMGNTRFDINSKLNSMTSGVLMESANPAKTLDELGIDSRFETLADVSSYEDYPYALSGNEELVRDFYPHYSVFDLLFHYIKHPTSMMSLLEIGTRSAFQIGRDYVGNYEQSSGMPERGRTIFFTLISNFKTRSAPKTLGYIVLIFAAFLALLNERKRKRRDQRRNDIGFDIFTTIMMLGVLHMVVIILYSGSSEMERYSLILGCAIDIISLMTAAEGLHRLNILKQEGKPNEV